MTASELDINPANHPNTSLGSNSVAFTDAENHRLTRFFVFLDDDLECCTPHNDG
ncbi:hypothetical protein BYT27DRAFT_7179424 [Phlegmacium glaucopus]|nr:hypothetical protein BYT27DRAFT_7179424 [Phlegmacium glaucopus]